MSLSYLWFWLMSTNSIYGGTCIQRVYMCVYIHMFHLKCGVPQLCFLVDKPPIDYIMFYVPFLFLSLTLLRLKKTAVLQGVGAIKGTALKCPSEWLLLHTPCYLPVGILHSSDLWEYFHRCTFWCDATSFDAASRLVFFHNQLYSPCWVRTILVSMGQYY